MARQLPTKNRNQQSKLQSNAARPQPAKGKGNGAKPQTVKGNQPAPSKPRNSGRGNR